MVRDPLRGSFLTSPFRSHFVEKENPQPASHETTNSQQS